VGGGVDDDVAAGHAGLHGGAIVEVAAHGGGAEGPDGARGGIAAREGNDVDAARPQLADGATADEAGAAGDECSFHGANLLDPARADV
jgi:hypothetical protein